MTSLMQKNTSEEKIKELFSTLIKYFPKAIIFLDLNGNIVECTDNTLKLFETSKEEFIGKNFIGIVHESLKDKVLAGLEQLRNLDEPMSGSLTFYKSSGKTFEAEVYANLAKDVNGKPFQIMLTVSDLTERGMVEKELCRAKEFLNILMEAFPDSIYFKDNLSRFIKVNRPHAERMGLKDPEEAVGKTDFDFYSEEFARQAYEDEQKIIRTRKPLINKVEKVIKKDGTVHWVSATKVPILDKDGKVIGIVGISRNITELKRMEEALKSYSEHLEKLVEERTKALLESERLAAIGEIVSMLVHDLRSPLQVILYKIFLLREKLKNLPIPSYGRDSFKEILDSINEQVVYMNMMVSDFKDYARNVKPEYLEIDLKKLVEEVIATFIFPENVKVKISIQEGFPKLLIDPMMVRRVLSNLISNAIDALPHGGSIYLEAKIEGEEIVISVKDTGVGISEENLGKLFKPFFTTKDKGTGLGLAICRRFVEMHGGHIFVESKAGSGTKFTIKIPVEGHVRE